MKEQHSDNRNTAPHPVAAPELGNQSVARALAVLRLLAAHPQGLGIRDIAKPVGLAPSIVQRLINTMAAAGYVERSSTPPRYRVGYTAFEVGNAYLTGSDLTEIARTELRALTEAWEINSYLGVLREDKVVYLLCVRSNSPLVINTVPGSRGCLHATAFGKALLADMTDEQIKALLGREPYEQRTPKSRTSLKDVLADIRDGARRGHFLSDGENLPNVLAVGAPVRDATGRIVAAISAATLRTQIKKGDLALICRAVRDAAANISRRLGAPPRQ